MRELYVLVENTMSTLTKLPASANALFDTLLLEPLLKLAKAGSLPERPIVLVVDALDESVVDMSGNSSLIDLMRERCAFSWLEGGCTGLKLSNDAQCVEGRKVCPLAKEGQHGPCESRLPPTQQHLQVCAKAEFGGVAHTLGCAPLQVP